MNDLDQVRVELRAPMASWVRIRDGARLLGRRPSAASGGAREVAHLRARIAEHTPSPSES
jgi:hypothetical protein